MNEIKIDELLSGDDFLCECGKRHKANVKDVVIESGAIAKIPSLVKKYGCRKAFLLADENTFTAAGKDVMSALSTSRIEFTPYIMGKERIEPDEHAVGSVLLHFDHSCDMMISVGSGVINDIGKIISSIASLPYMIVGTAPSMDGYASGTSSVIRDALKVSVDSRCPDIVVGDLNVLCNSPMRMIQSGIGDMVAKYISICEWKISHIINGEYYCERTASLINAALKKCVENVGGIKTRDKNAIGAIMEGMVLSGIAANYAGISRPVSGMEHYFSHIWDMRSVEFGTVADFHGIQCGIGTIDSLKVYEEIAKLVPDRKKALAYAENFNYDDWKKVLIKNLGKSADAMIANEEKEHKYDRTAHKARLDRIISHWDEILSIIKTLPSSDAMTALLKAAGAPVTIGEIGLSGEDERNAFLMTKDIRDKYIGSRLLWDLGELDVIADKVFPL